MKGATFLCVLACLLFAQKLNAQVCTGDFVFETQTELDQFIVDNPTCSSIDGDVTITGSINGDLPTNLDALQNIESISGNLTIDVYDGPFSMIGLSSLTTVGGDCWLFDQAYEPNIISFEGMNNLVSVHQLTLSIRTTMDFSPFDNLSNVDVIMIEILDNPVETTIGVQDVFPGVIELSGGFYFYGAGNFVDFSGFHNLVSAGSISFQSMAVTLYMSSFNAFNSLITCENLTFDMAIVDEFVDGFGQLQNAESIWFDMSTLGSVYPEFGSLETIVDLSLVIYGINIQSLNFESLVSASIVSVTGTFNEMHFDALASVDDLYIQQDPSDTTTTIFFPVLDSINGNLGLYNLASNSLNEMFDLSFIGGSVVITECENLSYCSVTGLCERLAIDPLSVVIMNNAPGCNTNEEVQSVCSLSSATGLVFADINCDGSWNAGDIIFPNVIIHDQDNMPIGSSNSIGSYHTALPDNMTTVIHAVTPSGFFPGSEYTFTTTNLDEVFSNYDFPLCPDFNFHDVRVYGNSFVPRPGFYNWYSIYALNEAVQSENVMVSMDLSTMPGATISSTNGTISGNVVSWTVNDLTFLETESFYVQVYVDPTTPLGTVYNPILTATLLSAGADDDPSDNVFSFNQTVVGSYDPNDKSVNRTAIDVAEIPADDGVWLDYTIRFQNTGTAEAITVRVEDVIAENLDLSTFQPLDASHSFDLSFDENRKVEWLFNNIMLPDSNTNEPESHGFIHFRIKTIPGLGIADVIENNAAIYFDFNEPVITNTATTIFYECTQNAEILGLADVCEGSDVTLTSSGVWNEYLWTMNGNSIGTSNLLTIADLSAGQQTISLNVSDTYCSDEAEFVIDVTGIPSTPVITQSGNTLTASGNGIFSWTFNGEAIADNDNSIDITESGVYGVSVMETMCASGTASGSFEFVNVEESTFEYNLKCYPNPANDVLFIEWPDTWIGQNQIMLTDLVGKVLIMTNSMKNRVSLNLNTLASGTYQIVVINEHEGHVSTKQIFVE
ncbi:MAG: T9SS type A sorting domain-containing protein [Flavobacteriales bacterium]|nr:T9SS type A sorting domain-containing protein [Flavobacteriales bacterium]